MVRRILPEELPDLLRLYSAFHPESLASDHRSERMQSLWQEIQTNPWLRYYGAEVGGRIISTCTVTIVPNLNHGGKPYALMENVVTDPVYRNKGWGTKVIQYAFEDAWKEGCYKVMLLTGSKLEETLRFYEGAGFRRGVKTGFIAFPPSA